MNMSKGQQVTSMTTSGGFKSQKCVQLVNKQQKGVSNGKQQFSSLILFILVIIIVNLSSFQSDLEMLLHRDEISSSDHTSTSKNDQQILTATELRPNEEGDPTVLTDKQLDGEFGYYFKHADYMKNLRTCFKFFELMFTNPIRLNRRRTRSIQAEARVLGKMAKVWYIKKKIKKLSKKLKKHTIAVPVFTAIPIYEHSYYPQPHVTHVTHGGGMHHAAAASSYAPAVTQAMAAAAAASHPAASQASQQLATSASTNHQQLAAYSRVPSHYHHPHQAMYNHPMHTASSHQHHQIINSYAPSPPLFVDDSGGLYGHYGNAYGRYDGGYQLW